MLLISLWTVQSQVFIQRTQCNGRKFAADATNATYESTQRNNRHRFYLRVLARYVSCVKKYARALPLRALRFMEVVCDGGRQWKQAACRSTSTVTILPTRAVIIRRPSRKWRRTSSNRQMNPTTCTVRRQPFYRWLTVYKHCLFVNNSTRLSSGTSRATAGLGKNILAWPLWNKIFEFCFF